MTIYRSSNARTGRVRVIPVRFGRLDPRIYRWTLAVAIGACMEAVIVVAFALSR